MKLIGCNSIKLPDRPPRLIFTGGGYGSGKTTIVNKLALDGTIGLNAKHMVGVDYFKLYMPEFSLITSVADGRASLTVQQECKNLSDELYKSFVAEGLSFIWDSSMSNEAETRRKIEMAAEKGYELSMIAVLTPEPVAIKQAMERAFDTRRFPNPVALPESHGNFRKAFSGYLPHFQDVLVFGKVDESELPMLIGKKSGGNDLAIADEILFNRLIDVPI
jgi:hypothetical protein